MVEERDRDVQARDRKHEKCSSMTATNTEFYKLIDDNNYFATKCAMTIIISLISVPLRLIRPGITSEVD